MSQEDDFEIDTSASDHSDTDSHASISAAQLEHSIRNDPELKDDLYRRVHDAFDGEWSESDETQLAAKGWSKSPPDAVKDWKVFVPFWTAPDWDPKIETTMDGQSRRAVRGDSRARMRAAILPRDEGISRTGYTL